MADTPQAGTTFDWAAWMRDHPGDWVQCVACQNWTLGGKTTGCAQCPPEKKPPKRGYRGEWIG